MTGDKRKKGSVSIGSELFILALFNLLCLLIFMRIDLLEWLYTVSLEHEEYELDEIIPLFITISISLSIFSFRRVIELRQAISALKGYATHDYLTELYNRRYITKSIELEIGRFNRSGNVFSVLLLDIDDFKAINDSFGHNAGDAVLTQFADVLSANVRANDLVSRWGGEEFLILCPETDLAGAETIANALLSALRAERMITGKVVSASLGAVCYKNGETLEALIYRADVCLYTAKEQGKDCYVLG